MQNVTTHPFIHLINRYGVPDFFFTEFMRVHKHSTLEKHILKSINENETGRPIFAQLIGENLDYLKRTVDLLLPLPIAGIDLNLGCPAPKVYKKNVGGGLLRDPDKIHTILTLLRKVTTKPLSVKMRIGFEDTKHFNTILDSIDDCKADILSIHARTVKEMYRGEPHYQFIGRAVERMNCPVLANGNLTSVRKGIKIMKETRCAGLMIGRSAIRNPWLFRQLREFWQSTAKAKNGFESTPYFRPTLTDVRHYIDDLWTVTEKADSSDWLHVCRMKKFLNFIAQSVDPEGAFIKNMRRVQNGRELFKVCDQFLLDGDRGNRYYQEEPFRHIIARPNHE